MFGIPRDDEGMESPMEGTTVVIVVTPEIEPNTTVETPKTSLENFETAGTPVVMLKAPKQITRIIETFLKTLQRKGRDPLYKNEIVKKAAPEEKEKLSF